MGQLATGPGTATTFMGPGVSRSHEKRNISKSSSKVHSGVSSAVRQLPLHSSQK